MLALFRHSLLNAVVHSFVALCVVSLNIPLATCQAAPSTVSSKEKVNIIVDREVVGNQSFILVKIMTPESATVESFALSNPARIVVDFIGLKLKKSEDLAAPKNGVIKQFRLGAHPDKLRVVIDLATANAPAYEWKAGPRQAILRISEGEAAAPPAPAAVSPTIAPSTPLPTSTPLPSSTPRTPSTPTQPLPTKTAIPATPTTAAIATSTVAPTPTHTFTPQPRVVESLKSTTAPKLPEVVVDDSAESSLNEDADEKEIADALEKEVAAASQAISQGDALPDEEIVEEDSDQDSEDASTDSDEGAEPNEQETPEPANASAPALGAIAAQEASAQKATSSSTSSLTQALKPNVVPATPVTSFTVEKASFEYLDPGHHQAFKLVLNQPGAQAQVSKIDGTTYKIAISSCGVGSLGLALPQYPPSDYTGLGMVSLKTEGDRVEITVSVQPGTTIMTFMRDREMWIKKQ
jgi:hypothetical protein